MKNRLFGREIGICCSHCRINFEVNVPFGNYLNRFSLYEPLTSTFEEVKERMGRKPLWVRDIVCKNCGCCSGLNFIK